MNRRLVPPRRRHRPVRPERSAPLPLRRRPAPARPTVQGDDRPVGRIVALAAAATVLFGTLIGRLWYLQFVRGAELHDAAAMNQKRKTRTVPPRGDIVDRNGVVLVTNTARFAVYIVPAQLPRTPRKRRNAPPEPDQRAAVLNRLAELLEESVDDILTAMKLNGGGSATDPVLVKTAVTQRIVAQIAEHQDELPGVLTQVEPARRYPLGSLAAHVLGYTKPVTSADLKDPAIQARYRATDYIGRAGIERRYDELLAGKEGGESYEVNRRGNERKTLEVEEPTPGATLTLTLDTKLQRVAEAALGSRKGAAVVLDPRNGEVLALASTPTYDLNLWSLRPLPPATYKASIEPFQNNNALQAFLPPGSTLKIVTLSAGLATGKLDEGTTVFCNHGLQFRREKLRCMGYHGQISLYRAFAVSCNAFFGQTGIWVGQEALAQWCTAYGLGERTGIDIPGEIRGNVDGPRTQKVLYRRGGIRFTGWSAGMSANMGIGQGGMAVTPIQMANVAAAVANGGTLYEPHVLRRAVAADGSEKVLYESQPKGRKVPLSAEHLRIVRQAMFGVVNSPGGTSGSARVPGISVWGKSGSAEARGNGGPTHAWFTCYAARPGEEPSIAVCIWLDSGGQHLHGGSHAAPVARKILAARFGIADSGSLNAGAGTD